jgi:hypothetical protein
MKKKKKKTHKKSKRFKEELQHVLDNRRGTTRGFQDLYKKERIDLKLEKD